MTNDRHAATELALVGDLAEVAGDRDTGRAHAGDATGGDAPDDDAVIDLQLQSMAFAAALRYAERVVPRSLLDFLA